MQNYKKLLLFLLFIPLAAIAGYYLLTFLLVGPAEDNFFELKNHDVGTHEVSVEILNSHNESVFKESYKLLPDESVSRIKPFNLKNSFDQKKYTFKVVLDNGVAEERTSISLHRWSTAIIDIYWDNETPIMIGVVTV
ncbi:hypothetical protein [Methanosarcina sp.]|uniref:hypothetical protein n=1 Tax=Methanosarcina sp. TaxID=2213 RepID=UPI0029893982|nr:hypothetical protein [Methanosarcina sp.]MDW5549577.1 hypothetical protein [Methanosarcina sp.]MDW5553609.1 hypothetical protein [Methanosarcina sp.]MDW5558585.1 hypothetical protein [Methanosarcina sp.]